jgi:hypothetical protein
MKQKVRIYPLLWYSRVQFIEIYIMHRVSRKKHTITIALFTLTLTASIFWFMVPPTVTKGDTEQPYSAPIYTPLYAGKHIIIYLQTMKLELHDGTTTIATLPLLSQGKPGSYYETIGGNYANDYKIPLHFSSIGHVYMPHSIHLFGNYFIHGIPYYPDGSAVSSTYSGGCIRLTDENAKIVYDFVERGTPIIVTRDSDTSFTPTKKATTTLTSIEMTNIMIATISLEFLTQDNEIVDTDGVTVATRRTLLPRLVKSGDSSVAHLYANSLGETTFISLMNQKAAALGLSSTHFESLDEPVVTSYEDYERFMTYITTYKSYLRTMQASGSK